MRRRIWTVAAGLASAAALVAVPSALAAYASAKLEVRPTPTGVNIRATGSPEDDPTASVRIFAPTGTQLTTSQAPGTALGTIRVLARILDLAGAQVTLAGRIVVATPGQVSPSDQAACLQGATPVATWVLALSAPTGQNLPVPAFLVATTGGQAALGPAYIQVCLRPPDVPEGTPGRQPLGAKAYVVDATVNGVFGTSSGTWIAFWTPYRPGVGQVNAAGTIGTPAAVAAGSITAAARTRGVGATVTGRVTQGGQSRAGAVVTIFGGTRSNRLRRLGQVRTSPNGAYNFRARSGVFFRANAAAVAVAAPAVCTAISAAISPIPCVNPTTNGFTAQSKVVRKK
jgi:hypothetical protein